MKLTKEKLQHIIEEELQKILKESDFRRIGSFPGDEETLDAMYQYLINKGIYKPMSHQPNRVDVFSGYTQQAGEELQRAVKEEGAPWTEKQARWLHLDLRNQTD